MGCRQEKNQGCSFVKIRILDAASQDLIDGARFYEKQGVGLGGYFRWCRPLGLVPMLAKHCGAVPVIRGVAGSGIWKSRGRKSVGDMAVNKKGFAVGIAKPLIC